MIPPVVFWLETNREKDKDSKDKTEDSEEENNGPKVQLDVHLIAVPFGYARKLFIYIATIPTNFLAMVEAALVARDHDGIASSFVIRYHSIGLTESPEPISSQLWGRLHSEGLIWS